ncbi:hypothetical protein ACIQVO_01095 [Streptomyces sp. NPDC101062]|uniref:hypothetical protein n=1 Tax=unclassified Streptomyces TaxID=2593676 RepID=UPI002E78F894|nr:hypothetical protein [Streptomyces sp. JV176]MEE1799550.1 hypothetical protein [Streptomyces sp. JV176]
MTMLWQGPPITGEDLPTEPREPGALVPCAPCLVAVMFGLRSAHRCEKFTIVRAHGSGFAVTTPTSCPCACGTDAVPESA